jgi:N-acetylmuramoyl-L-alanine amidase
MRKEARKVFLSAGHTNVPGKDRGASGNGYIEGELTVEFRDMVAQHLRDMCITVYTEDNSFGLRGALNYFRKLVNKDSIVIDFHWNAATPAATGTEVLIPEFPSKLESQLAYRIAHTISAVLNIRTRGNFQGLKGVKSELSSHHGRLGWMRLTGQNILPEICFITNARDMEKYQANKIKLAYEVARDIANACYECDSEELDQTQYTVVSGDTLSGIAARYNTTTRKIQQDNNLKTTVIKVGQVLTIK